MATGRLRPLFRVDQEVPWDELRRATVDEFENKRREDIWYGFSKFCQRFYDSGLRGDIFIGGSFVTDEDEPNDIDFTVVVTQPAESCNGEQVEFLRQASLERERWRRGWRCDFEIFVDYRGSPGFLKELDNRLNFLCLNLFGPPKGMVLVRIGGQ